MKIRHLILVATLVIAGCATPYQKRKNSDGFLESKDSRNTFTIIFTGNSHTPLERAADFAVMRCAELTLENGFRYFIVTTNRGAIVPPGGSLSATALPDAKGRPVALESIAAFRRTPVGLGRYYDAPSMLVDLRQKYGMNTNAPLRSAPFLSTRATLGIIFEQNAYHPGAFIRGFVEESDGARAGFRSGDEVVSYNGVNLRDAHALNRECMRWDIGETVNVTVRRNGDELTVRMKTIPNAWEVPFSLRPRVPKLSPTDPNSIRFLERKPTGYAVAIGNYFDWENPFATLDEFKQFAAFSAARIGADAVWIVTDRDEIHRLNSQVRNDIGFGAWAMIIPRAWLGIEYEPADLQQHKVVIRKFTENSLAPAAGLKIGDKIVTFNGIDQLETWKVILDWMNWKVGDVIQVGVVRDGVEVRIPVRAVANP